MTAPTWTYGVTTVPNRINDLLPRTLESLKAAGFDQPRLFADGCEHPSQYTKFGLDLTTRWPKIRTYGNWVLALAELFIREPARQRYAIFQDDILVLKNLRSYLDRCPFPDRGYWNLYSVPVNERAAPDDPRFGAPSGPVWYEGGLLNKEDKERKQMGKGAVALVFSREGVMELLRNQVIVERPADAHRGWRNVDGGVVTAMNRVGWREWVHYPSLVQHVGERSEMGNSFKNVSLSFPGAGYDALEMLK